MGSVSSPAGFAPRSGSERLSPGTFFLNFWGIGSQQYKDKKGELKEPKERKEPKEPKEG